MVWDRRLLRCPQEYKQWQREELSVGSEERLAAMWNTVTSVPTYMVIFRLPSPGHIMCQC